MNYRVRDNLVLGFGLNYSHLNCDREYSYHADYIEIDGKDRWYIYDAGCELGFTWDPGYFILNGAIGAGKGNETETRKTYAFRFVILICSDFELGIGYSNQIYNGMNDEDKNISFQYNFKEENALRLSYDTTTETWALLYHRDI